MPPSAVATVIAFAIEQPPDIEVGEIVIRSTAQKVRTRLMRARR
jgi:NADP-dependent 3-hydroxy acid dehydrogenase YdfG